MPRDPADERLADPDWLREQYVERDLTIFDIADECDCNQSTVSRWLDIHGVDTGQTSLVAEARAADVDPFSRVGGDD
jgi:hypothetical protein